MKNLSKRAFSLLLAVLTVISITQTVDLKTTVFAKSGDFTIVKGVITKYNGYGGVVTIPNGVTGIGNSAFQGCTGLTGVIIPDSVTFILGAAFAGDYDAEADGYSSTNLASVTIGSGVISIENNVFAGCDKLTQINVDSDNRAYSSEGGVLYNKEKTEIVLCPKGKSGSVTVPNSIKSIEANAFSNCSGLTSVIIPGSVKSIGTEAFRGCIGLTSITIPDSVTSIGDSAFYYCSGLSSVTIPDGVTSIGDWVFAYCYVLKTVIISESVTSIGDGAFSSCKGLAKITIPNSVKTIGGSAFSDTAWYDSKPVGLVYAGKAVYRYKGAMPAASLVKLKNDTASISEGAFTGCTGLVNITIPGSVISIGSSAFSGCTGLKTITIPGSVTSIGDKAFYNTAWLGKQPAGLVYAGKAAYVYKGKMPTNSAIVLKKDTTSIAARAFAECYGLKSITIPYGVKNIGPCAFIYCSSLERVAIPNSVTFIGASAFTDSGLKTITIPDSVKSIEPYSFSSCHGLTKISLGKSVTNIGRSAFEYCNDLASITIPNGVTAIEDCTFNSCSALTSIIIPDGVTFIGVQAFTGCTELTTVTIPGSVTNIDSGAFSWCRGLTGISISGNTVKIASDAFNENDFMTVFCPAGSYAEVYSKQHSIAYSNGTFPAKPSAPASLTAAGISAGTVSLSWPAVTGATGYNIYIDSKKSNYLPVSETTYTATYLTQNTAYSFSVKAVNAGGASAASTPLIVTTLISTPYSLKAISGSYNSIKISWKPVSKVTGYVVFRLNSSTGKYSTIKVTTSTSYTDTSLTTGETYYYKVKSYKTVNGATLYSISTAVLNCKPVPSVPANFKATGYSDTSIKLSWSTVAGATGYEIYKYNPIIKDFYKLKVLTATSYINSCHSKGVDYSYKVRGYTTVNGVKVYGTFTASMTAKP